MRIFKAAQHESKIYDRNRETLFGLREATLRAQTHQLVIQIHLSVDARFEAATVIDANRDDPEPSQAIQAKLRIAEASRRDAFERLMQLHAEIPPLIAQYEKITKHPLDAHDIVAQPGLVQPTELASPQPPGARGLAQSGFDKGPF